MNGSDVDREAREGTLLFWSCLDVIYEQFMEPEHRTRLVFWLTWILLQCLRKSILDIALVWLPATWRDTKASGIVFFVKGLMVSKWLLLLDGKTCEFMLTLTH